MYIAEGVDADCAAGALGLVDDVIACLSPGIRKRGARRAGAGRLGEPRDRFNVGSDSFGIDGHL